MPGSALPSLPYPNRTRQRVATRDRVFEASLAEFRRVGVAATQIEDIVRKAGVARGTFYLHFPTKDHVLLELARRRQQALADRLARARVSNLRMFLRRTADVILEDARGDDTTLWHEMFAVLGRQAALMRSEHNPLVELLTRSLAAAQQRGEIRGDLTPADLVSVLLPGLLGLLQMRLEGPVGELRTAMHRIVDVFVRGVSGGEG